MAIYLVTVCALLRLTPVQSRGEYAELIGQQTFITAGPTIPAADVNPRFGAAKEQRFSQTLADSSQSIIGFIDHADAIERIDPMPRLRR
jgi:hypothetical protein